MQVATVEANGSLSLALLIARRSLILLLQGALICASPALRAGDRLLATGGYVQTTFPRGTGPEFVDWVDYAAASAAGRPLEFAARLEDLARAGDHRIFLVWAGGYQTFGVKCEQIVQALQDDPAYHASNLVIGNGAFYQPMSLVQLTPTQP